MICLGRFAGNNCLKLQQTVNQTGSETLSYRYLPDPVWFLARGFNQLD